MTGWINKRGKQKGKCTKGGAKQNNWGERFELTKGERRREEEGKE
jgi:hypothetical protein